MTHDTYPSNQHHNAWALTQAEMRRRWLAWRAAAKAMKLKRKKPNRG